MPTVDLRSAQAKLHRARKQCRELEAYIDDFQKNQKNQATLRADLDPESGYHVIRVRSLPDYGLGLEEVSLGVGDVVNNLRCGLDHLTWQYACAFANGTPRKPQGVDFKSCYAKGGQHKECPSFLDPAVWSRMHEYQPCRGINGRPDSWSGPYIHELDLLTQLSNSDKHRMLALIQLSPSRIETIPTRAALPPWVMKTEAGIEFVPERIGDPDPGADHWDFSNAANETEIGAEVGRVCSPLWQSTPKIDYAGAAIPRFYLPEGRPVIATLQRLAVYVERVIDDLQRNHP